MPLAFLPLPLPPSHGGGHVLLTRRRPPLPFDPSRRPSPTLSLSCSKTLVTTHGVGPPPTRAGTLSSPRGSLPPLVRDGQPACPEESPPSDPAPGTLLGPVPSPSLPLLRLSPPPGTLSLTSPLRAFLPSCGVRLVLSPFVNTEVINPTESSGNPVSINSAMGSSVFSRCAPGVASLLSELG